ncbi:MAG: endonuclease III domain-containing protein [Methanobrevibacter sp.]|jgi:endonuclease-3 related protein|nr:endonuclease III domain-containing protein [Methanobrevibacter sp.]
MISEKLEKIYEILLKEYSYQGWWPFIDCDTINPNKTGLTKGYHPKDYEYPKTEEQEFEIIIGAILTQNTNFRSVDMALKNLSGIVDDFNPKSVMKLIESDENKFKEAIRCAGYYNQKSEYIKNIAKFYLSLNGKTPSREDILSVKGVGNETADTILLYAYKECEFVVDAYTKRIFSYLGYIHEKDSYMKVKKLFEDNLPKDLAMYQEYHALIVEHAKKFYSKKPYGANDSLLMDFKLK